MRAVYKFNRLYKKDGDYCSHQQGRCFRRAEFITTDVRGGERLACAYHGHQYAEKYDLPIEMYKYKRPNMRG